MSNNKILYIEDNFQNFRLVMRMLQLEPEDYHITQAADGETGLKMVDEFQPDLILMDINLPDIDGAEVTRRIKAQEKYRHIPIVALTANAMVGDRERYLDAGCDDYLRKPISRADLKNALKRYLGEGVPLKADAKAEVKTEKKAEEKAEEKTEEKVEVKTETKSDKK